MKFRVVKLKNGKFQIQKKRMFDIVWSRTDIYGDKLAKKIGEPMLEGKGYRFYGTYRARKYALDDLKALVNMYNRRKVKTEVIQTVNPGNKGDMFMVEL